MSSNAGNILFIGVGVVALDLLMSGRGLAVWRAFTTDTGSKASTPTGPMANGTVIDTSGMPKKADPNSPSDTQPPQTMTNPVYLTNLGSGQHFYAEASDLVPPVGSGAQLHCPTPGGDADMFQKQDGTVVCVHRIFAPVSRSDPYGNNGTGGAGPYLPLAYIDSSGVLTWMDRPW